MNSLSSLVGYVRPSVTWTAIDTLSCPIAAVGTGLDWTLSAIGSSATDALRPLLYPFKVRCIQKLCEGQPFLSSSAGNAAFEVTRARRVTCVALGYIAGGGVVESVLSKVLKTFESPKEFSLEEQAEWKKIEEQNGRNMKYWAKYGHSKSCNDFFTEGLYYEDLNGHCRWGNQTRCLPCSSFRIEEESLKEPLLDSRAVTPVHPCCGGCGHCINHNQDLKEIFKGFDLNLYRALFT